MYSNRRKDSLRVASIIDLTKRTGSVSPFCAVAGLALKRDFTAFVVVHAVKVCVT
jgi:hypothetical protein